MSTFFIIGPQRSGTTLLAVLLGKHKEIDIPQKSTAFRLISCFSYYKDVIPYNAGKNKNEILTWLIKNDYQGVLSKEFDFSDLDKSISIREAIEVAIGKRLAMSNKSVFGDKSPELEHYIPEILALIPDAKFLHLVRDGRAAAYSKYKRTGKSLLLAAQEWVDSYALGLGHQSLMGTKNYKLVSYEGLVQEPESTLKDICSFLALDFDPQMLQKNSIQDDDEAYAKSTLDASKINDYLKNLHDKQLKGIEKIQAPFLKRFGYELHYRVDTKKHKQLNMLKRLMLSQKDNWKRLFVAKREGMAGQKNVSLSIPLKMRLKTFVFFLCYDFLSKNIFRRLFRRRWIKSVYMDDQ